MNTKVREAFEESKRLLKKISPLLLSHHPLCSNYRSDLIKIGDRYFCKGCFLGYSFSLILILVYLIFEVTMGIDIEDQAVMIITIGVGLGSTQLARAFLIDLPSIVKTLQKIMLGAGIALVTIGILELGLDASSKVLIFIALAIIYGIFGMFLRIYYIKRICRKCKFREQWNICDGLSFLYDEQ